MPSVISLDHQQSRFLMLFNSQLRVLHCPIYDLDNLDACTLHAKYYYKYYLFCYSPILTRRFGSALHRLLVLAKLLSLTSFEGEPPAPISTPWGAYRGAASYSALTLIIHSPSLPTSALSLEELEALWLGANLMVHRWPLMCANHIDMIEHTPAFFTKLGTTRIYVECSTAGPSHVSHYGALPAGWSPIHVLTRLMIA